jgi:hypothetical protein
MKICTKVRVFQKDKRLGKLTQGRHQNNFSLQLQSQKYQTKGDLNHPPKDQPLCREHLNPQLRCQPLLGRLQENHWLKPQHLLEPGLLQENQRQCKLDQLQDNLNMKHQL